MMWRELLLLAGFWLSTAAGVLGQHHPLRHFSAESGLPKSMVAGITQDEEGFLWLGTSGGVCRFDGTTFTLLKTTAPVEYFYAKSFLHDSKGDFWLGMQENGLVRIIKEQAHRFTTEDGLPDNSVRTLLEDHDGNLWAGTDKGLAVLRSAERARGNFFFQAAFGAQLSNLEIYRVVGDAGGRIWINTAAGLFLAVDGHIVRHWPQATRGRCLARHPLGFILVAMPEGLFRSDGDSLLAFYRDRRLHAFNLTDFAFSGTTIWIATYGHGLLKLQDQQLEIITESHGLVTEYLYSLLLDREGSLWVGSIHGLSQLYEPAFANYTKEDGLISNSVHAIEQDVAGNVYLGGDHGLSVVTQDTILTLAHSVGGLPVRRVVSMKSTERGKGVIAWTEEGMKFRVYVSGKKALASLMSRAESQAAGLRVELTDRFGNQWLSTPDSGIYCTSLDGTRLHWTTEAGLPTNSIFDACEDTAGSVWFSTIGHGVLRFRGGGFDRFSSADGLPSDHIEGILVHPQTKRLWFATNNGPARWRGDDVRPRFETFPEAARLPSRDFGGMAVDKDGNMWFTTSSGVVRYDGTEFEMFTHEHGLVAASALGILVDHEGHVWTGGARGATKIFPRRLRTPIDPPKAFLTRIEAKANPIARGQDIELSHRQNDLRFVFRGLSLRYPRGLTYSYRLDGLDSEWAPFSQQNEVRFPSLPPGSYRFRVRAMNIRGAISETPAEFAFTILPPVWRRWWFLLLSAVVLYLTALGVYRLRVKRLLAIERMRTRIAADLHDDIASSLASMALYSEVIQRQLQDVSEDVRALLGRIRDLSREVMENIGIIVWAVDPRRDQLSEVLAYFQRQGGQLCAAAGISFVTRLPEKMKPMVLSPEQRRTIYLILKEGLNNILRHAKCSEVEFSCTYRQHTLELALRDNGRGFEVSTADGGHGLSNMRMRAEAIAANLEIGSRPGLGTAVHLRLRMT